jgi:RNA polymerase sigma factor (TIGR02999 family)
MSDEARPENSSLDELKAAEELLPLVYDELRRLAAHKLSREAPGQTLQATALVHEVWLRLVARAAPPRFAGRTHFMAVAAEAMRRILIDAARRKQRLKRGGLGVGAGVPIDPPERVNLAEIPIDVALPDDQLLALDDALSGLAAFDEAAARVVKLCFFGGLTHEQAGQELGLSVSTVERRWAFARAWIFREMRRTTSTPHA